MSKVAAKNSSANAARLTGLLSLAIGVFGLLVGVLLLYASMQGQLDAEQASTAAQDQAREIGDALDQIQSALDNPQVIELARAALRAAQEQSDALEAAVQNRGVANIIDLRVFPAAIEDIPLGDYPEPDFTVIEMLIEARRNGVAPMQVHYPGSVNENLALAQAVEVDNGVEGVLFLRVPVSMVISLLQISQFLDSVAIVQGTTEPVHVLRSIGQARGDVEISPIAGTRFHLNWTRRTFASSVSKQSAVIVLSIGVILLMLGLLVRRRFGALDAATLRPQRQTEKKAPAPESPQDAPAAAPARPAVRQTAKPAPASRKPAAPEPVLDDLPDWLLDSDEIDQSDTPLGGLGEAEEALPDLPDTLSESVDDTIGIENRSPSDEQGLVADTMFFNPDDADFFEPEQGRHEAPVEVPDAIDTLADESASNDPAADDDELADTARVDSAEFETEALELAPTDEVSKPARDESDEMGWDDFKNEIESEDLEFDSAQVEQLESELAQADAPEQSESDPSDANEAAEAAPAISEEPFEPAPPEVKPELALEAQDEQESDPIDRTEGLTPILEPSLFRANSISGRVGEHLDARAATLIGEAVGSEALSRGVERLVIGRDGRLDGAQLMAALTQGLQSTGLNVIDLGALPIPVLNFAATEMSDGSSVMVTGSHYSPSYNGFRIRLQNELLHDQAIQSLRQRIDRQDLSSGSGELIEEDGVIERYMERIGIDIQLERPLKVVVDCGNGISGSVVPGVLSRIGADVIPLYADVDGSFPNHLPNPADPDNLEDLKLCVRNFQADLGLAFDGDGDRMAMVASNGDVVWTDRILMLLAPEVLERNVGARVVIDSASSTALRELIQAAGGKPIIERSAEAFVDRRMREDQALLGGIFSGHVFIAERWYPFDDAIYASARLLEQLAADTRPIDEILAQLPQAEATPEIRVDLAPGEAEDLVTALIAEGDFGDGELSMIDGLRVDYPDGWGLVRASHRSDDLVLRFEGASTKALNRIRNLFKKQIKARSSGIKLAF